MRLVNKRFAQSVWGLTLLVLSALTYADPIARALAAGDRLPADLERDLRDHPEVILAMLNLQPGARVADIFAGGGYYSELIARVVAPGEVLLVNNPPYQQFAAPGLEARFGEREVPGVTQSVRDPGDLGLGDGVLDAALIVMSWHDLYYGAEDWPQIDREDFLGQIVTALKPGGHFLIVDHSAVSGADLTVTETLHRIDERVAREDIVAGGLEYVGSSEVLRNPDDDRSIMVFDPAIRGKTDRFVLLFRKPLD